MFYQKDLFYNKWSKSFSKSKTIENLAGSVISDTKPFPICYIIFNKRNAYYNKILCWLDDNNMEYQIKDLHEGIINVEIIFRF